ncbi:MAG TPA: hypothetical protein PLB29_11940 [Zoogloea sp.]|nr:hypothetical protein [Zoogloea sp.]
MTIPIQFGNGSIDDSGARKLLSADQAFSYIAPQNTAPLKAKQKRSETIKIKKFYAHRNNGNFS